MKLYLFVLLAAVAQLVSATYYPYKSTFYGCPKECNTEKHPKCDISVPGDRLFAAISEEYFGGKSHSKHCGSNYVGMIIDDKADSDYKLIRAKIIDQCGSCDHHQVDLSADAFEKIAKKTHGVVSMVYVFVDKEGQITEGPIYSKSALEHFAKSKNVSKSDVLESFKEAARNLAKNHGTGMKQYPWVSGKFDSYHEDHDDDEDKHEHKEKTTKKTTTKKTTTTTTKKTTTTTTTKKTTTTTTTTTVKKTLPPFVKTSVTSIKPVITTTVGPVKTTPAVPVKPIQPVQPAQQKPVEKPKAQEQKEKVSNKSKEEEKKAAEPEKIKIQEEVPEDKGDNTATYVGGGALAISTAAGLGLLMLKRKSPEKYDDLKQKFPEAFGTVKRSITRGASTIKRGVSRSVSRSGRNFQRRNEQTTPLPASYTFTLSSEDGLPRVALYDDPYPTKTHGTQHW